MQFNLSWWSLLLSILLFQITTAKPVKTTHYGPQWRWMENACNVALNKYTFGFNDTSLEPKSKKFAIKRLCTYEPFTGSMLLCFSDALGEHTKNYHKALGVLKKKCQAANEKENYTEDFFTKIYNNATFLYIDSNELKDKKKIKETVLHQPIRIEKKVLENITSYYSYLYFNFDNASKLSGAVYVYFLIVFVIYGIITFLKRLGFHRKLNNSYINWYRANVSIPALFNGKHTEGPMAFKIFTTLIPTRAESIVIFFYLTLNITLSTVHYSFSYTGAARIYNFMTLVSDRTGIMAFGGIPLLIIFAGRNNLLTSLTGIQFQTLIHYHKWAARVMWSNALVHSVLYSGRAIYRGSYSTYFDEAYLRWGVFAVTIAGLIIFQAFRCFRNMSYETFLVVHIVFAVAFIIGCYYHCYDVGYMEWIYVSWALWAGDRVQRIIRMCLFGFREAEIELISDSTFKLSVKHNKLFKPFPGAFAYLYLFTPSTFWQSHPFTIIDSAINEDETTIYIKAKEGATRRIKSYLNKCPGSKKTITVSIEGPYGHRCPMEKYDTALLLSGGNGIPGPYYHAIDLSRRESAKRQQIKLLWSIRNPQSLFWFYDELNALARTSVQTNIYITGQMPECEISSCSDSEKKKSQVPLTRSGSSDTDSSKPSTLQDAIDTLSGHITFHYGRPDLEKLILENFTEEDGPSVGVMTCGPPKMVDSTRAFTAKHLQKAKGRIDLFEELQVW